MVRALAEEVHLDERFVGQRLRAILLGVDYKEAETIEATQPKSHIRGLGLGIGTPSEWASKSPCFGGSTPCSCTLM